MERTIVMVHGMMVGPWCWENYKGFFEGKGYRCLTPSLRFHDIGPNDPPDPRLGKVGLLDYAADLEKELRGMAELPILMGHSMGGLLVQILASRGLARAAVLLTPAAPRGVMALKPSVIWSFSEVMARWGFWKRPFRFSFEKAVYSTMHLMDRHQQEDAYRKMVYESGRAAFQIGLWLLDTERASEVDHDKVRCPVLVVAGRHDRITPPSVVRKVAAKYKAVSTYKEFKGHAHWVLLEPQWEEVAQYVSDWLAKVLG